MPTKLSAISESVATRALDIGADIRARRKSLGVSATAAAEAAGMSRVTWFRIEKGTTSVTLGAYLSALQVLDLDVNIIRQPGVAATGTALPRRSASTNVSIPVRVVINDYPQLKSLAWQLHGVDDLSLREALDIYERNWRHLDEEALTAHERNLITALKQVFGNE